MSAELAKLIDSPARQRTRLKRDLATLKEKFEKRGDHWIAKAQPPG